MSCGPSVISWTRVTYGADRSEQIRPQLWTRNAMEIWKMMQEMSLGQCLGCSCGGGSLPGTGQVAAATAAMSGLPPPGGTATSEEVPNSLYQPITM